MICSYRFLTLQQVLDEKIIEVEAQIDFAG
jgi:hypothetical protein